MQLTYEDAGRQGLDMSMIAVCRKLRRLAKLDRLKLDENEHRSGLNRHLFDYIEYCGRDISPLAIISLALVFAGGLGNAIDRFEYGYVVDMISTIFIDFPVFNVADIGVTCGIVLFVISIIFSKDYTASDGDSGVGASSASGRVKGKGD